MGLPPRHGGAAPGKSGPHLIFSPAELPADPVAWVLAPEGADHLLLGTTEGVFRRSGSDWRLLPAVSNAIAGKLPVDAVELRDGRFAIGTYLGGIVIASVEDRVESVINRVAGLPNDYVYTLCTDSRQNLWVGLEGALARIGGQGVTGVIDQRLGLQETPVTKILSHAGRTLALTSRALYDLSPQDSTGITRSADFPGHPWATLPPMATICFSAGSAAFGGDRTRRRIGSMSSRNRRTSTIWRPPPRFPVGWPSWTAM